MASTLGAQNPLRYRGYVYDEETGLYYLQSRYYNPEIGRFLNSDAYAATGQGLLGNNMFAYCLNDPVRYMDYSGFVAVDCFDTDEDLLDPEDDTNGGGGGGYVPPSGGGGVSSNITIGSITITFGHGGRHVDAALIPGIQQAIANDVITQPPSFSQVTHNTIDYMGGVLDYGYFSRSEQLINVGTFFFLIEPVCY